MMLVALVIFILEISLRHEVVSLLPITRAAFILSFIVAFLVGRRYLAPRLGTTTSKAALFGLGAGTITFLYFAGFYSIFETGDRISDGYITTIAESVDAMAEIATRVLTSTFDLIDFGAAIVIWMVSGMLAETFQRMWGPPIRAPRV